ncbi:hypothetical protein EZS27_016173 [termite gut metagenome]|uniref:Uncharacterized protein n=1 Tax=termite gut metagenome TaxID=433724 RepID=A0A5J4RNP4_9ZZZZ
MRNFMRFLTITLIATLAFGLSSCSKHDLPDYKKVHYDVTAQGYVKDTITLSNTDINLHFVKLQSIELQINKFYRESGLPYAAVGKLKLKSGSMEDDVDAYLKKAFGKHITYDIVVQGVVEYSSFVRFDIYRELKK